MIDFIIDKETILDKETPDSVKRLTLQCRLLAL